MDFYRPKNLLGTSNTKIAKSGKKGYTIYALSLTPSTDNILGKNLCPASSEGCVSTCLAYSGHAFYPNIIRGRKNKANYFALAEDEFMMQLYIEILKIEAKHKKVKGNFQMNKKGDKVLRYKNFAIRLNTFSDIPYYAYRFKEFGFKNIFELFPNVQFYDYTKVIRYAHFKKKLKLDNWHLTFSKSETNDKEVKKAIELGLNVAVVFKGSLPKTYLGREVINGDETDLTFTYPNNVIVGVLQKNVTAKPNAKELNKENKYGFFVEA